MRKLQQARDKLLNISVIYFLSIPSSSGFAAILDVEANGIYGGFWRDLYKFGPVVIDTVGGDLGIFLTDDFKMGFSFATIVGLLSDKEDDDIFGSVSTSSKKYNSVLNALDPADFSYSTAAFKTEYILYEGDIFGVSTTNNLGVGVLAYNRGLDQLESDVLNHPYVSQGLAGIIKITKNFRMSLGVSYRKDVGSGGRPEGFEELDAVTIYNHVYVVKF